MTARERVTHQSNIERNLWFLVVAASVSSLGGFLYGYENNGTFGLFACMALVNVIIVLFFVPETKGLSLEEIGKGFLANATRSEREAEAIK